MFNFIDRGIIPGATDEFINFIEENIQTNHPDLYIGLLQSSFIVGFCLASPIFAGLVHHYGPFHLVCIGVSVWTCAVIMSGFAYRANSYEMLLFGRVLSGVGESSFQCCIPPWIATNSNESSKSIWLAIFNTAIPVGTAIGYIYSSIISTTIGWQWTFFLEAILICPFLLFLFSILPRFPHVKAGVRHFIPVNAKDDEEIVPIIATSLSTDQQEVTIRLHLSEDDENDSVFPLLQKGKEEGEFGDYDEAPPNILEEVKAICQYPCYLYICAGYAAQTGALIGLSTFGSAFLMGLGFFDSEVTPLPPNLLSLSLLLHF
jgi:MFS transporter, Spinster family, sphingosine-1-phosphate transporter